MHIYIYIYIYELWQCSSKENIGVCIHIYTNYGSVVVKKTYVYEYICIYIFIWQRLKSIALVTGPGTKRLVTESADLSTNPPCDKPIEDYGALTEARD